MHSPLPALLTRRATLALAASGLAGCGFALRTPPNYAFRTVYLIAPEAGGVRTALRRALEQNAQVRVLAESADRAGADVLLEVPGESREKVVSGRNVAGQVREFVLRTRLRFRLRTPSGLELLPMTELLAEREIGFAEQAALAKEEEEALLYRDMRQDLVQQMLRRLAAVPDLQPRAPR
jgi:LPS-assembly lipoprotein